MPQEHLPLIAVPTTAGTGSEVTCVSVLTDHANGKKSPIVSDGFFPSYAIIDPENSWPTFFPADLTGEEICEHLTEHEDEEEAEYDEHVWLSLRNAETLTQTIADALCERMLPTRLSIRKTQQTILPSCLNWTTNIRMLLQTLNAQRFCSPTAWSSAIFLNRNCFRLLQISSDCFTMYSGNISSRGGTLSGFLIFILPPRGNFLILWGCLLSDWMSL